MPGPGRTLRDLLAGDGPLVLPGAYDAASARVAHALGYPAVYLTGFGMEASMLGMPDIGLAAGAEALLSLEAVGELMGLAEWSAVEARAPRR